ncbi:MAG: helix-turn-helix transcriptional regulator [Bacteroidetes bacterium]|nr:helix-turn-helix transcriptional regulator [Bacteroidota bacterium]MBK9672834.1 helix-turn-helix transcriptional regulator [Bacteroidota bacterium]
MLKEVSPKEKKTLLKFGKHLRELRLAKGLTQEKLNFKADLSKNAVGLIERGEINCSILTLEALAQGLDISLKKLIDFE